MASVEGLDDRELQVDFLRPRYTHLNKKKKMMKTNDVKTKSVWKHPRGQPACWAQIKQTEMSGKTAVKLCT